MSLVSLVVCGWPNRNLSVFLASRNFCEAVQASTDVSLASVDYLTHTVQYSTVSTVCNIVTYKVFEAPVSNDTSHSPYVSWWILYLCISIRV